MSVHVMAWVLKHAPDDFGPCEMAVAMMLAWHADDDGKESYPSVSTLQQETRLGERTIRRAIKHLVEVGMIRSTREATRREGTVYCFPLYRGAAVAPLNGFRGAPVAPLDELGVPQRPNRGARAASSVGGVKGGEEPSKNRPNTPYGMFAAACEAADLNIAAFGERDKGRYLAVAKRLGNEGLTADETFACVAWLSSQAWRTQPPDLFDVEKNLGKWRAAGRPTREPARRPTSQADHNRGGTGKVVV